MKWTWITPYELHKMVKEASDAAHKAFMVAFRQALKGGASAPVDSVKSGEDG